MTDPDWAPLERALPEAERAGFMFMGYSEDPARRLYKHGITRRYLALDQRARAYRYTRLGYLEIPLKLAIEEEFEGLEQLNATCETVYDEAYRASRHAELRRAGYRVLTIEPD